MRRFVAVMFVFAVATGAAAGSAPPDSHVTDACGDADVMARLGDAVVATPDPARAAAFDIEAAWFEDLTDGSGGHHGVRVNLHVCGDVAEPDVLGGSWAVQWTVSETCSHSVTVGDWRSVQAGGEIVRRATLASTCSRPSPTLPGWFEIYTDWSVSLPDSAFAVQGDVISWTLTPDLIRDDADAVFLRPGATWLSPHARARDGRQLTIASFEQPVPFHLGGPGAADEAGGGRDFTVGA